MELKLLFSLAFLMLLLSCLSGVSGSASPRCFTSLFTLGDSHIDTGNFPIMARAINFPAWVNNPPYGMTFFGRPTGRQCDGRVIVDFMAEEFGLPFLPPSLANSSDVSGGVNFAVGGATAIAVDFFEKNKLVPFKLLNNSLDVQVGWFQDLRPSLCNNKTKGPRHCFGKSLFVVGEFGVNDYNFFWMANKTEDQVRSYVPSVVKRIASAVERLIKDGAAYVVVPGNPPSGCLPSVLVPRRTPDRAAYDRVGCLRGVNAVVEHHNRVLRRAVGGLRARHPHATVVFADFYTPIYKMLKNPRHFGLLASGVLMACCGTGGGAYNWNASAFCGMPGVAACRDPAAYVSWDGVHYTEAVNRYVAEGWLNGTYADPPILTAIRN